MRRMLLGLGAVAIILGGECGWNTATGHGTVTLERPRPRDPLRFLSRRRARASGESEVVWLRAGQALSLVVDASVQWGAADVAVWPMTGDGSSLATTHVTVTGVRQIAAIVPASGLYSLGVRPARAGLGGRVALRWRVR